MINKFLRPIACKSIMIIMLLVLFVFSAQAQYPAGSPVAINGKLKVVGTQLSNECGNPVQLRGMGTHGPQWFQNCYTNSALDALVKDWGIDVFRLAMYVEEGGYVNNPTYWKSWIDGMVDACGARGIYCVIDWHVLNPGDPNADITAARDFWTYMSTKHSGKKHVLYEICNEPNGVTWSTIKTYANDIIPRIRANDASTVIIVGTPTWSQDVDIASNDKLNFSNLMYTLHFYSGTHTGWLRDKANTALTNGAPLFITEFGTSSATGDGGPYLDETQLWMDWAASKKISWINWSFADKSEVSAALTSGACSGGNWNSTSPSGTFVKQHILSPADNFVCNNIGFTITASAGTGGTISPSGSVSVASGTSKTFSITPSTGYVVNAVTVDGTSVGAVTTYTFTNVTANHTISATFKTSTVNYTITASAGAGGTITPSGSVSVASGTNSTFTIAASSGYQINAVTVDGTSVGAVGTYTFTNVTANHTIAASFSVVTNTQTAYPNGVAWAIPGTIESVNYDNGGEGVAYHDTTVGNAGPGPRANENVDTEYGTTAGNVGWIVTGEWLEYTVNVSTATNYDIKVQVASSPGGGAYHIEFNGVDKTGLKSVPATGGWATFATQTINNVALSAGIQVMRVYMDAGNFNIGAITISKSGIVNNNPVARVTATPTSGVAPVAVSFSASTSTDADGDALTYAWNFGDGTTGTGVTASHTYAAAGSYTATVTANDGKGGTGSASIVITVTGGSNNCKFGTPLATALPSIANKSYSKVYVLGTGGPNLSNVTNFTINWDLPNNGLWQLSMNTSNGVPNWYVDLKAVSTYVLNQSQPRITLTNSGFSGLDGQYYVNIVGSDFVMVSVTKSFTLYFSNSATAPTCTTARLAGTPVNEEETSNISVSPNPSSGSFKVKVAKEIHIRAIDLYDSRGVSIKVNATEQTDNEITFGENLSAGFYILRVQHNAGSSAIRIIKK